ncbi:hypothetical protein JW824_06465 [bacterium]|nr:hypothetical protein [bacterium]RQV95514.1 MAG: hypothetical protein EH221_05950 [bacterium]
MNHQVRHLPNSKRTKILACATVIEEMLPLMPDGLTYIDTDKTDQNGYKIYARDMANHFHLQLEEIQGSNTLVKKMIFGPWDDKFVVVPPGQKIRYTNFKKPTGCVNG